MPRCEYCGTTPYLHHCKSYYKHVECCRISSENATKHLNKDQSAGKTAKSDSHPERPTGVGGALLRTEEVESNSAGIVASFAAPTFSITPIIPINPFSGGVTNIVIHNHIHMRSNDSASLGYGAPVSYPIEEYHAYPRCDLSDKIFEMIRTTNFENFSTIGEFQQIMTQIYAMDDGIVDRFLNRGTPPQKVIMNSFVANVARTLRKRIVQQSKHRHFIDELASLILRYETMLINEKKTIEARFQNQPTIEDI